MHIRLAKPTPNTIAHVLAICVFALITSIVLGAGRPSHVHAGERATQFADAR